MTNIITTNNQLDNIVYVNAQFGDGALVFSGAGTELQGTILARDSVSLKFVPFVVGGTTNGNGIAKAILTYDVTATGAGDIGIRPLVSGKIRVDDLVISSGAEVTQQVKDALNSHHMNFVSVQELSIIDDIIVVSDFSPLDLNPNIWYDPSDITTITKDISNRVSQMDDKSGNGIDVAQLTTDKQPIHTTGAINGKFALVFDGINDDIRNPSIGGVDNTEELTISMVVERNTTGNGSFLNIDVFGNSLIVISARTTTDFRFFFRNGANVTKTIIASGWGINVPTIITVKKDATTLYLYRDGALESTKAHTGTFTLSDLLIFGTGFSGNFSGKIAETVIFDRFLTTEEQDDLEGYLSVQWGISI